MWREKLAEFSSRFEHPGWGKEHCDRVYKLCIEIAEKQNIKVNKDALYAAAHLHDIGAFQPYKVQDVDHAESSYNYYKQVLVDIDFPEECLDLVGDIIKGHMFYEKPSHSLESMLFHDADTLDFMGIIGITRILSIVGIDNWTPNLKSAIELISKFKDDLPNSLCFEVSKAIGAERNKEMENFLARLSKQTYEYNYL